MFIDHSQADDRFDLLRAGRSIEEVIRPSTCNAHTLWFVRWKPMFSGALILPRLDANMDDFCSDSQKDGGQST